MNAPFGAGAVMNSTSGRCGWCCSLAVWHGIRGPRHEAVWACDDHRGHMLLAHVDWFHSWTPACGVEGSRFSPNRCIAEDEERRR